MRMRMLYLGEANIWKTLESERRLLSATLLLSHVDASCCHRSNAHPVSQKQDDVTSNSGVDRLRQSMPEGLFRC